MNGLLCTRSHRRQSLNTCLVQPHRGAPGHRNQVRTCDRRSTTPSPWKAEKKQKPLRGGSVSLDKGIPHKGSALTPLCAWPTSKALQSVVRPYTVLLCRRAFRPNVVCRNRSVILKRLV